MCQGATAEHGGSVALLASASSNQSQFDEAGEGDGQPEELLYFYPRHQQSAIVSARGLFLTLMHVIPGLCHTDPQM